MASSTLNEWIAERERSPYRSNLFYDNSILIVHQTPNQPDDLTKFPFYNVFIKNRLLFEPITVVMPWDRKYYYRPKKLSYDLYGDIGLWHVLMILNKVRSEEEFIGTRVKYLKPDEVMDYISRMFIDEGIDTTMI
jgi:hypothetical protein